MWIGFRQLSLVFLDPLYSKVCGKGLCSNHIYIYVFGNDFKNQSIGIIYQCFFLAWDMPKTTKVSSANLERSYRRAPKGAGDKGTHNVVGPGVCHLCTCGQGVDWEDLPLGFTIHTWQVYSFQMLMFFACEGFKLCVTISTSYVGTCGYSEMVLTCLYCAGLCCNH
jgi:hypothetical protein